MSCHILSCFMSFLNLAIHILSILFLWYFLNSRHSSLKICSSTNVQIAIVQTFHVSLEDGTPCEESSFCDVAHLVTKHSPWRLISQTSLIIRDTISSLEQQLSSGGDASIVQAAAEQIREYLSLFSHKVAICDESDSIFLETYPPLSFFLF